MAVKEREIFAKQGDVLIISGDKEMLVSSHVLSLASSVFNRMLEPGFLEGNVDRSQEHPLELSLPDDDPEALTLLFHIIHFSPRRKYDHPHVDLMLQLVQLADKYDCARPVQDASERWLRAHARTEQDLDVLVILIAIAFFIESEEEFQLNTAALVTKSSAGAMEQILQGTKMPQSLKGLLRQSRLDLAIALSHEIEKALDNLRQIEARYTAKGKICVGCERWKPPETIKCHTCRGGVFLEAYCDSGTRVRDFLRLLELASVWPFTRNIASSAVAFRQHVDSIQTLCHHSCSEEDRCPLRLAVLNVELKPKILIAQCKGINLFSLDVQRSEFLLR